MAEYAYRFSAKRIRALFLQMIIAQYLCFLTLTALLHVRKKRRDFQTNRLLLIVFIPIHLAYWALIIMGSIHRWSFSAECSTRYTYPNVVLASNALFAFVFLVSLFLHYKGYFVTWNAPQM